MLSTWESPIRHADDRTFTSATETCRNNLPAGFITVMDEGSLVSATQGKDGLKWWGFFIQKKKEKGLWQTGWWTLRLRLLLDALIYSGHKLVFLFIKYHKNTGGNCIFHMLHHVCFHSRLVQCLQRLYAKTNKYRIVHCMHVDQVVLYVSQAAVIFMFSNLWSCGFWGYYSSWVDISSPCGVFIPALEDHSGLIGIHVQ